MVREPVGATIRVIVGVKPCKTVGVLLPLVGAAPASSSLPPREEF